jgi:hypothetical protein
MIGGIAAINAGIVVMSLAYEMLQSWSVAIVSGSGVGSVAFSPAMGSPPGCSAIVVR